MSVTISKGRMFRVSTAVDDERLKQMRKAPELANQATSAGAEYWHSGILPKHFKAGMGAEYGYAPRSRNYLKQQAGKPALVASGSLRRDLLGKSAIKSGAGSLVELMMTARVLRLVPTMPENSDDLYVTHGSKKKGGAKKYPNLKREIKAITDDEREAVAVVVTADLEKSFGPTNQLETSNV